MRKLLIKFFAIFSMLGFSMPSFAAMQNGMWINDLKDVYARNQAIILAINIRSFNAVDKDNDDIIEIDKGEVAGNFVNAVGRLNEIKALGINTIHILPITPVGKVKAIGTAGSLYAASSFSKLNPQLDDPSNDLSVYDEAKNFIKECHKRDIRVIVDLPSCGAYDMFLAKPNLFMTDKNGQPVVPADWTDVRMFKAVNDNGTLNDELFIEYKNFVDMAQRLGADGIRADVATSKPFEFWQKLISYARGKDSKFLFIAEASEAWSEPVAQGAPFTPYYKLLEAGFDGWYGSFFNFKDWTSANKLEKEISMIKNVGKDYKEPKAVIGSFATHDEVSPIITGGQPFSDMIIWLQATLPVNSYFVDGIQSGDSYQYKYANQKASKTYTDDDYYYVHQGKFDIFNFSRKPGSNNKYLTDEFFLANKFKTMATEILNKGEYSFLNTGCDSVFAYTVVYKYSTILVVVNKDLVYPNIGKITLKNFSVEDMIVPLKINSTPSSEKNKFNFDLRPGEVSIMLISKNTEKKK